MGVILEVVEIHEENNEDENYDKEKKRGEKGYEEDGKN